MNSSVKRGKTAVLLSLAAALVVAGFFFHLIGGSWMGGQVSLNRSRWGKTSEFNGGETPLVEFTSAIRDYTGLEVILEPDIAENTITLSCEIVDADGEMVRGILEKNGYVLRKLPGKKALLLRKGGALESLRAALGY